MYPWLGDRVQIHIKKKEKKNYKYYNSLVFFSLFLFFSHTYIYTHLQKKMISTPHEEKMIGDPLLSENVANVVTAVSLATRISLRCSSLFLDALFEAAKYGTSLSLGITRNTLTNALVTAKNLHSNDLLLCSSEQERERYIHQTKTKNYIQCCSAYINFFLLVNIKD